MNKTYHFMAGLPRSGSTVLSAILNQNPNVYSSPTTDLLSLIYDLERQIPNYQSYQANLMIPSYKSVLEGLVGSFYSGIDKRVILDKNRGWGTPYNWNNLRGYVNADGKIILTLRPILEMLASFVRLIKETEAQTGFMPYLDSSLCVSHYRNPIDAVIDTIMMPNSPIDRAIFSTANLLTNHRSSVHVVWYNDLVETPKQTLDRIYDFLELDKFEHDFKNIVSVDNPDDFVGYGVNGLHDVKKELIKSKTKPEDYLSDYVINKYGNALDFMSNLC